MAFQDSLRASVVDFKRICHAARASGICRRNQIEMSLVDHEGCCCAGITVLSTEEGNCRDRGHYANVVEMEFYGERSEVIVKGDSVSNGSARRMKDGMDCLDVAVNRDGAGGESALRHRLVRNHAVS